ncbi:MAG: dimethylargininase [Chloroflexi bacterium]|nr:dimethylargininase [Chloroflexota bacterium]
MLIAITRDISPNFNQCELTHLDRAPIDVALAQRQHHQYQAALCALGCEVIALPAEPDLPDSVFVEDVAIVLDEVAIITRPGADSRKPEARLIAEALKPYRELRYIGAPGTVDGGDVLRVGKTLYVGLSSRSNQAAIDQMQLHLASFGYSVQGVQVTGCLHLKSAVTQVAVDTLLINPQWVDAAYFKGLRLIEVDPGEPGAANAVWADRADRADQNDGGVIYPSNYPKTQRRLIEHGVPLIVVDSSEVQKAEGAVTCCSLIFQKSGKM